MSPPPPSVPITQPIFIEWENIIHRSFPPSQHFWAKRKDWLVRWFSMNHEKYAKLLFTIPVARRPAVVNCPCVTSSMKNCWGVFCYFLVVLGCFGNFTLNLKRICFLEGRLKFERFAHISMESLDLVAVEEPQFSLGVANGNTGWILPRFTPLRLKVYLFFRRCRSLINRFGRMHLKQKIVFKIEATP